MVIMAQCTYNRAHNKVSSARHYVEHGKVKWELNRCVAIAHVGTGHKYCMLETLHIGLVASACNGGVEKSEGK